MTRKICKITLAVSIILLILIAIFAVGIYCLSSVAAIFIAEMDPETFTYREMSFSEFFGNFIGSPMFYVTVLDVAALVGSAVGLAVTKTN